jgi:serine/threonine protein phosphatase 1
MTGRTFAIGDIHGDLVRLRTLLPRLPSLTSDDTLVFLGDYVDRGDSSREVVRTVMTLTRYTPAKVVCLRGNHEDAWLVVRERGWPEFVLPEGNGCWDTLRSYTGKPAPGTLPARPEWDALVSGSFFPDEHVAWMRSLPIWYEDEHAIYVHAGLPMVDGQFPHPKDLADPRPMLWQRSEAFFRQYEGKRVVCGHTPTETLPDLSTYTPDDPTDAWMRSSVVAIDTGCGRGGFLTAIELPSLRVFESR